MTAALPRQPPRFGPEPWRELADRTWSLWDLWFCVIALEDHGGNLDDLAAAFVDDLRSLGAFHRRRGNEAKLSHVLDLGARLGAAEVTPADLASPEVLADTKVTRRARDKVTRLSDIEHRAQTPAMIDTPRRVLSHRARYGLWDQFPSDPDRFLDRFRPAVDRRRFLSKGQTFAIAERLGRRLADLDGPRRALPDRLALYRAFHTAGLELADTADDSYGVIGELRHDTWKTYLAIDWRTTGIDPTTYWRDLCELMIWEPYAVDYTHGGTWFRSAGPDDVDRIEAILLALEHEHRVAVLDHEADHSLERLADLYVVTGVLDRCRDAAELLGSRAWRPIEQMAIALLETGNHAAAVDVFRAADQPGWHQQHLRDRCRELTGDDLTSSPATLGMAAPHPRIATRAAEGQLTNPRPPRRPATALTLHHET